MIIFYVRWKALNIKILLLKLPNMKIRNHLYAIAASCGLLSLATQATAHTISVGSFNAGSPGSVNIVLGTYDHSGPLFQGSISLISGPTVPPTVTNPFTSVISVKPAGLIDGVNNFYADATSANYGALPSDSFTTGTNLVGLGPVVDWMSSTFTGLTAGTYTYQLSDLTSANWQNINSFQPNWTGTIIIPETSISGVPDGGTTLALLGLTLSGIVGFRRKFGV